MNDVKDILNQTRQKMEKAAMHLENELITIRAGKASPHVLDNVMVDYYGTMTPLTQVASVIAPDARTITITPWEKKMIDPIERAILAANLNLTPQNNGELVRIIVPALTEDRRKDLVKMVKHEGENARVSIRNARREGNEAIKKAQKDGVAEDIAKDAEAEMQKLTDQFGKRVDEILEKKEKEILTV
ncbi:MAG TPA: ribosome recycling factor [Williamwhitmania sp.]|nr:ribosome recycling factor [Williamwhitmania sp.]